MYAPRSSAEQNLAIAGMLRHPSFEGIAYMASVER